MIIDHVCIMVSDIETSMRFYGDLLGFKNVMFDSAEPGTMFQPNDLDAILGVHNAETRVVMATSDDGTMLEIQQATNPLTQRTPDEYLRYGRTGITELAFRIDGIDEFFAKVRAAGYRTQTEHIWSPLPGVKSFLFYDPDGALIQVVDPMGAAQAMQSAQA